MSRGSVDHRARYSSIKGASISSLGGDEVGLKAAPGSKQRELGPQQHLDQGVSRVLACHCSKEKDEKSTTVEQ